ncbi:hypothetical protein O0L34_g6 [Tuta absoluta]|nr:hypothetical protein O0L34_g6 [Tuta absoluta]
MAPALKVQLKQCAGCKADITNNMFLKCSAVDCGDIYDLLCANVSEKRFCNIMTSEHKNTWVCPQCQYKQPKQNNTNTPVRQQLFNAGNDKTDQTNYNANIQKPMRLDPFVTIRRKQPSNTNNEDSSFDVEHNSSNESIAHASVINNLSDVSVQEILSEPVTENMEIDPFLCTNIGESIVKTEQLITNKIILAELLSFRKEVSALLNEKDEHINKLEQSVRELKNCVQTMQNSLSANITEGAVNAPKPPIPEYINVEPDKPGIISKESKLQHTQQVASNNLQRDSTTLSSTTQVESLQSNGTPNSVATTAKTIIDPVSVMNSTLNPQHISKETVSNTDAEWTQVKRKPKRSNPKTRQQRDSNEPLHQSSSSRQTRASLPEMLRGTAAPGPNSLRAAERKHDLHLYNVLIGTTVDEVRAYLNTICKADVCTVMALKARGEYASFKISVPTMLTEHVLDAKNWPEDICIRQWRQNFRSHYQKKTP